MLSIVINVPESFLIATLTLRAKKKKKNEANVNQKSPFLFNSWKQSQSHFTQENPGGLSRCSLVVPYTRTLCLYVKLCPDFSRTPSSEKTPI